MPNEPEPSLPEPSCSPVPDPFVPVVSVVSPLYGAPDLVMALLDRLELALREIGHPFEVVLVNDACPRGSWDRVMEAMPSRPWLVGINLSRNFGQHVAITAGLAQARGEWIVVMDCDLQDRPEELPGLWAKTQEGFDTVFGRRCERRDSWTKTLPGDAFALFYRTLTGIRLDRSVANFSISHRKVIAAFLEYPERDRAFAMLVHTLGFRRGYVDVLHAERPSGRSGYTWRKLFSFALQFVVSGSNKPLRLSIKIGLFIALFSMLYSIYLIVQFFRTGVSVPGWTTLTVLVSIFSGMLFIQLGVIGIYLGKVFDESKRRPLYHIQDVVRGGGRT